MAKLPDIEDFYSEKYGPNWTVTKLFVELETVSFCNAVIRYMQTDFIYINDTKTKFIAYNTIQYNDHHSRSAQRRLSFKLCNSSRRRCSL